MTWRTLLFGFRGSIARFEFWRRAMLPVILPLWAVFAGSMFWVSTLGRENRTAFANVVVLGIWFGSALCLWMTMAVHAKRLHDLNRSGLLLLLLAVPLLGLLVGIWIVAVTWFLPGKRPESKRPFSVEECIAEYVSRGYIEKVRCPYRDCNAMAALAVKLPKLTLDRGKYDFWQTSCRKCGRESTSLVTEKVLRLARGEPVFYLAAYVRAHTRVVQGRQFHERCESGAYASSLRYLRRWWGIARRSASQMPSNRGGRTTA